jgi:hypothetical protein
MPHRHGRDHAGAEGKSGRLIPDVLARELPFHQLKRLRHWFLESLTSPRSAGKQVRFAAFGSGLIAGCTSTQSNLMNVTWSVTDAQNVTISNTKDVTFGVATCVNATSGPVTVTATLSSDLNNGVPARGTSTMTCN